METPNDNSRKFRHSVELIIYLFTPHTFHRSMKERKPVGYKIKTTHTRKIVHKNQVGIMESTELVQSPK